MSALKICGPSPVTPKWHTVLCSTIKCNYNIFCRSNSRMQTTNAVPWCVFLICDRGLRRYEGMHRVVTLRFASKMFHHVVWFVAHNCTSMPDFSTNKVAHSQSKSDAEVDDSQLINQRSLYPQVLRTREERLPFSKFPVIMHNTDMQRQR